MRAALFLMVLAALFVMALSTMANAAVPTAFSVQGILRDNVGHLQSMTVSVSASLWDAQSNGNKLAGDYGPTDVVAMNGLFTMPIDDAALQSKLTGAAQVWLEVKVGTQTFARQQITSQLFAQMCGTADKALSMPNLTDVAGTAADRLDVSTGYIEQIRLANTADTGKYLYAGVRPEGYARVGTWMGSGGIPLVLQDSGGNVGIGTTNPSYSLDVNGTARIAGIQLFLKGGDNGTASCATFCRGSNWPGGTGECIGGKDVHTGDYVGCTATAGALTDWVCICAGIP